MHCDHGWCHEQVCLWLYEVSITICSSHCSLSHVVFRLSLGFVADGGTLAEEVFSTVRTAQAFGSQHILSERYDAHIEKGKQADMKAAIFHGCGLATFFFVIYGGYALGTLLFDVAYRML